MRHLSANDPAAALSEVLQFMRLLWAVDHGLQAASKRMQRELGVTGPQRLVIRVIGRMPGVSAGEVAAILHLHPSTVTGVLRRLESEGLISRDPHPGDRRRSVLHLTEPGRRIDQLQVGTVESAVGRALRNSTRSEQAGVRAVLGRIAEALTVSKGRGRERAVRNPAGPAKAHGRPAAAGSGSTVRRTAGRV